MDEHEISSIETKTANPILDKLDTTLGFVLYGFLFTSIPILFRLLTTGSILSAIWPHAVNTLEWTMWAREYVQFMPMFFFILACTTYVLRQPKIVNTRWVQRILDFSSGILLCMLALYFLLDVFYLQGAFLLLPTVYAALFLTVLIGRFGAPRLRTLGETKITPSRTLHIIAVFMCSWLLLPGLPASFGFAPSPPDTPLFGYGANPGPFLVDVVQLPYDLPVEVEKIRGDTESAIDFSIYLYLPNLNDANLSKIPLAILLHGFLYPDQEAYTDWIHHLAAKGIAVAFIQYPSDIWPKGVDDFSPTEKAGMSDFMQHTYRNLSIRSALDVLDTEILGEDRPEAVNSILDSVEISTDELWIGGHSLGAAYSFFVVDYAIKKGWGQQALMIDLESPASRPSQPNLQPTWTSLPENTIIHSVVTQDDMSVGSCAGAYMHDYFAIQAGNNSVFIEVPSDKYGFPRMVASHYLQTNPAHDALADWAFYRRIDAQADWLTAESRNDTITIDWARNYLLDKAMLAPMGEWSDGTPVLPLNIFFGEDVRLKKYQDC